MKRTTDWTPTISKDEASAFHNFVMMSRVPHAVLEKTAYFADIIQRHGRTVTDYAAHVSGEGFEVTIEAGSSNRCHVSIRMPNGEYAEDLFDGTIQIGYYAGQVDYQKIIDEALDAVRKGWAAGPEERGRIQDARRLELFNLLEKSRAALMQRHTTSTTLPLEHIRQVADDRDRDESQNAF